MCEHPYTPVAMPLLAIEDHTPIDRTFRFGCTLAPQPGQFMEVSLPGIGEAPFSISGVGEDWVDLTIRRVGHLTEKLFALNMGQRAWGRGPYGHGFDLAELTKGDLLVVGGGTGLVPLRPLIEHAYHTPSAAVRTRLILGFRSPDDILFRSDIERWKESMQLTLSVDRASAGWTGETGLVTHFIKDLPPFSDTAQAVVVGPPAMLKFATLGLLQHGLPETAITVSMERRMSCGIGKCGHCKIDDTYVCLDGPVMPYTHAARLLD
jgi:anaerobic sulfite reductase subunit B